MLFYSFSCNCILFFAVEYCHFLLTASHMFVFVGALPHFCPSTEISKGDQSYARLGTLWKIPRKPSHGSYYVTGLFK